MKCSSFQNEFILWNEVRKVAKLIYAFGLLVSQGDNFCVKQGPNFKYATFHMLRAHNFSKELAGL